MGGDLDALAAALPDKNFNSHPRVGGDWMPGHWGMYIGISIRTPAWGVTGALVNAPARRMYFNSHPRVGGDPQGRMKMRRG